MAWNGKSPSSTGRSGHPSGPKVHSSIRGFMVLLLYLFLFGGFAFFCLKGVGWQLFFIPHGGFSSFYRALAIRGTTEAVGGGDRVAICLAGGLRRFELTGPTLQAHLFTAYPNSDVFVVTPLDSNAFKLWVVVESRIVAVHIVKQDLLPEDEIVRSVVNPEGCLTGRQGIMHYSALVQRCTTLIKLYEQKHGFKYDWVLRTRPDGLWSGPPPSLTKLSTDRLYLPKGSDFTGINDRCTIATRDIALKSLEWVSTLPMLYAENKTHMIAEIKYEEMLKDFHLHEKITRIDLAFCVLTDHTWPMIWRENDPGITLSVSPIDAPGDAGGRYCRPCVPYPEKYIPDDRAIEMYHTTKFCDTRDPNFAPNWREMYDNFYGPAIAARRLFYESNDNFWTCVHFLEELFLRVGVWLGEQDQYLICSKHYNHSP